MEQKQPKRDWLLPGSIFVAALLISLSLVYNAGKRAETPKENNENDNPASLIENIKPVSSEDWVLGNRNASIKVIEFSDLECPFCKRFHPTMQRIVSDYKGEVAWVYRHLPLDGLHTKARAEAEAAECAGILGGNEVFWEYINAVFEITPSNDGLDLNELPKIAKNLGLNETDFKSCLDSQKAKQAVIEDSKDAVNSGGEGTPYSIVVHESGKKTVINGALPYEQVKLVLDSFLR